MLVKRMLRIWAVYNHTLSLKIQIHFQDAVLIDMNLHDNARVLVCVVLYSFILSFTKIMNPILADFPSSNVLLFFGD